jgi:hypothetical protein
MSQPSTNFIDAPGGRNDAFDKVVCIIDLSLIDGPFREFV